MSVTAGSLYQDLKKALEEFKAFLTANQAAIKAAVQTLKSILPQVGTLIADLIALLVKLKDEITSIDVSTVQKDVLGKVSSFTDAAKTLLTTAEGLLPNDKPAIDKVLSAIDVVSGLPSLDTVKKDILDLIDAVIADLKDINS